MHLGGSYLLIVNRQRYEKKAPQMYRSLFKRETLPDFHIILYNNLPTKMMEKGLGVCARIYPKRNDTEKKGPWSRGPKMVLYGFSFI